jgi:hypothetical protein
LDSNQPKRKNIEKILADMGGRQEILDAQHDWKTCKKTVLRLLLDGYTAPYLHEMMGNTIKENSTIKLVQPNNPYPSKRVKDPKKNSIMASDYKGHQYISDALNTRVPRNWRKVLMVVDAESPGESVTDFHFYAQFSIQVRDLYNQKLVVMLKNGEAIQSFYAERGINAFVSTDDFKSLANDNNRPTTNLLTHLQLIPRYCLLFICDPFWIFDVDRRHPSVLKQLLKIHKHLKQVIRQWDNRNDALVVINAALCQAKRVLRGEAVLIDKSKRIGLWGHKAGWATGGMNADGDGKLILDPAICNRDHGGYDYDTPCCVVKVLKGRGITSVPPSLKKV